MDLSGRSADTPDPDDDLARRVADRDEPAATDPATDAALDGLGGAARTGYRWRALEAPNLGLVESEITRAVQEARGAAGADRAETLAGAARRIVERGLPLWRDEDPAARAATLAERVGSTDPDAARTFLLGVAVRDSRIVLDKLEGRTGPTGLGGG